MNEHATIAVIMPVYNGAAHIRSALESVLVQTRPADAIIVVDDGSTDETAAIVAAMSGPGLELLSQPNRGPAAARNRGIEAASTDLLAFLDADDEWFPDKLERQSNILASTPGAALVMGRTEGIETGPSPVRRGAFRATWEARHFLQLGSLLCRRHLFRDVGPFDPSLRFGEDLDWLLRAGEAGFEIHTHDDPVLRYCRHAGNMTNDIGARDRGFMQALHKSIQRRRSRGRTAS